VIAPTAEDYRALHQTAAGRGVGRDVLRISGPDAVTYLQGQCTQDVAALGSGRSADALLLSPQGKLQGYVRVTRISDDVLVLDTEASYGDAVMERLQQFKLRVKADLEVLDWGCVSIRGPDSLSVVPDAPDTGAGVELVAAFDWGPVTGVDLLGPAPQLPAGVVACSPEAWEALRLETGIPALGSELDERTIAAEAHLLGRCVSFTKGCYTGQELVARLDSRGNRVARHLHGLVAGPDAGHVTVPVGTEVVDPSSAKVVGSVTSWGWSPVLGAVGLSYLHRSVSPPAALDLRPPDGPVLTAQARPLPLVG